jgi:RNA polymerase sigma factor (sigma-70 family)
VVGRLGHLRQAEAFDAYLRRTIVNLSKNHFRHRAVERAYLERYGPVERQANAGDPVGSGLCEYESMRRALLGLPARQRAALVLCFYEDLAEDQIAEILRCRNGTVRSLVSRGIQVARPTPSGLVLEEHRNRDQVLRVGGAPCLLETTKGRLGANPTVAFAWWTGDLLVVVASQGGSGTEALSPGLIADLAARVDALIDAKYSLLHG